MIKIQRVFDYSKQSATDVLETASKRAICKIVEATGDLIGDKIADEIAKVWISSPQNNPDAVENEAENIEFDKRYTGRKIHISRKKTSNHW